MVFKDKPLNVAFARLAYTSPDFREWLLDQVHEAVGPTRTVLARGDNPWSKSLLNGDDLGETDILLVFEPLNGGGRLALHIENKLPWDKFRPKQLEKYRRRATEWVGAPKWGTYHEWRLGLIAPQSFYDRNKIECDRWPRFVPYEKIVRWIPEYAQYVSAQGGWRHK